MRFFHLSDLHIGKQLYSYNLKDNQQHILKQIIGRVREYRPDAVLIAGDIFDKSIPSGEAYTVFDEFLTELSDIHPQIPVMMIAGNHDSAERLNYASAFLEKHKIYISVMPPSREEERLKRVTLTDQWGPVDFYLLPFTKPGYVRFLFPEGKSISYDQAIAALIERENLKKDRRNVILSHQFYVSGGQKPETCQSELAYLSVGGIDSVEAERLKDFDYGALGHLHGSQWVGREQVRYCGTPLKYSVSESRQVKSITMVTLEEKGKPPVIETIPLTPLWDVRRILGTMDEILQQGREETEERRQDFISITLTDEGEIYHPRERLQELYPNLLEVRVDNARTRAKLAGREDAGDIALALDPFQAFCRFYEEIQKIPMSSQEEQVLRQVIEQVSLEGDS